MRITIESTSRLVEINGVPARVWEGTTDKGVPVIAFIPRVAARADHDVTEFERDLQETKPPSADAQAFPARMVF